MNLPSVAPHRRAGKPCIVRHAGIRRCALGHVGGRCAPPRGCVRLSRHWRGEPSLRQSVCACAAGRRPRSKRRVSGLYDAAVSVSHLGDCLSRADHRPLHPSLPRPGGPAAVPLRRPVLLAAGRRGAAEPVGGEFLRWREGQRCAVGTIAEPGHPDPGERQAARRPAEKAETAARRDQERQGKRGWGAGADRRYPDQPGKAVPGREQPGRVMGQPVPAGACRTRGALSQLARPAGDGLRFFGGDPPLGLPGQRAALAQPAHARALRPVGGVAAASEDPRPAAVLPAQAGPLAGGLPHHPVPVGGAAGLPEQDPGDGHGLCAGLRHAVLRAVRDFPLAAQRPAPPARPGYPAAPGVPPVVADRQPRRAGRGRPRSAADRRPRRAHLDLPEYPGQRQRRAVHCLVRDAFPPADRPPDPQPAAGAPPQAP
ncbi:hypothetical protein PAERUG_P3_North_West_16_VIM_2_07_06_05554 [Pseudomonas aeruginosa]|nr:hypothetical protein PAERUG_P3_North_West_16_VIM_2_07_06_05554 [Pseudomonas aeruginosa]CRQ75651.1 hypothetical protein PAERUG_P45_London_17_VIM_2_12_12_01424 [Pseudomonas aeruginosa]